MANKQVNNQKNISKFQKLTMIPRYNFISWAPYCSRSDNIAREFSGNSFKVYYGVFGSNYFSVLFKYFVQAINTLTILFREKPDVIFVMNPPIFSCIPVWFYCKVIKKTGYIIDSHSAAFSMKRWQLVYPLQKYIFCKAITNIVTNKTHANIIKAWGADYTIIGDIPVKFNNIKPYEKIKNGFNVTVVNTFASTEPVHLVLNAAEQLKDINFYITGKIKNADRRTILDTPENVVFTDFLPDDQYAFLLKSSDIVMTQENRDNTMQRGAYEAMSVEVPIITSDWPLLRETFYKGTVFVKPEVDSIIKGIMNMKKHYAHFKKEVSELKQERLVIWLKNKEMLKEKIRKQSNF